MRRQIIILGCVLLFALPICGQEWPSTWPDSFIGDYMPESESPSNVVMYIYSTVNVWDEELQGKWYGTLWFGPDCDNIPIALIDLTLYREHHGGSHPVTWTYHLPWNDVVQSYVISGHVGDGKYNLVLMNVVNPSDFRLIFGTYTINSEGAFEWAQDYPIHSYRIVPDIRMRRPSERRSP